MISQEPNSAGQNQILWDTIKEWLEERSIAVTTDERFIRTPWDLLLEPTSISEMLSKEDKTLQAAGFCVTIYVRDAAGHKVRIPEAVLITHGFGASPLKEVLPVIARQWCDRTLPPILQVFGFDTGQTIGTFESQSYTEGDQDVMLWKGYIGQLQLNGVPQESNLAEERGTLGLLNQVLPDFFPHKDMLTFEFRGQGYANGTRKMSVEVNGDEIEGLSRYFTDNYNLAALEVPFDLRQFMIFHPVGTQPLEEANPKLAAALKQHEMNTTPREERTSQEPSKQEPAQQEPAKKAPWWRLGKR